MRPVEESSSGDGVALAEALGKVTELEGKLRAMAVTSGVPNGPAPQCACTRPGTKVFNLGFPKAGSSSLDALMLRVGCTSVHFWTRKLVNKSKLKEADERTETSVGKLIELAHWHGLPLLHFFNESVNAFTQMVSCHSSWLHTLIAVAVVGGVTGPQF